MQLPSTDRSDCDVGSVGRTFVARARSVYGRFYVLFLSRQGHHLLSYNIYRKSTVNTNQGEFMDWLYACNVFNVLTFDRAIILCPTVYIS